MRCDSFCEKWSLYTCNPRKFHHAQVMYLVIIKCQKCCCTLNVFIYRWLNGLPRMRSGSHCSGVYQSCRDHNVYDSLKRCWNGSQNFNSVFDEYANDVYSASEKAGSDTALEHIAKSFCQTLLMPWKMTKWFWTAFAWNAYSLTDDETDGIFRPWKMTRWFWNAFAWNTYSFLIMHSPRTLTAWWMMTTVALLMPWKMTKWIWLCIRLKSLQMMTTVALLMPWKMKTMLTTMSLWLTYLWLLWVHRGWYQFGSNWWTFDSRSDLHC